MNANFEMQKISFDGINEAVLPDLYKSLSHGY